MDFFRTVNEFLDSNDSATAEGNIYIAAMAALSSGNSLISDLGNWRQDGPIDDMKTLLSDGVVPVDPALAAPRVQVLAEELVAGWPF